MFYLPIKLRESKTRVTPKGPSFFWARPIHINIGGTRISFKAPRHRSHLLPNEPTFPREYYEPDRLPLDPPYVDKDNPHHVVNKWRSFECFHHAWAFNGPWFTGVIAELKLWVYVTQVNGYPENMSLFHPRALERVIDDYVTRYYSRLDEYYSYIQKHLAPVEWRPLSHLTVNAARFRVSPVTLSAFYRNDFHLVFVPFAKDTMLLFRFNPLRSGPAPECIKDRYSDITPVNKLIDDIINSLQVRLSPAALEDQRIALEGLEDTTLVNDFPPIKWDKLDDKTRAEVLAKIERERIEKYGF